MGFDFCGLLCTGSCHWALSFGGCCGFGFSGLVVGIVFSDDGLWFWWFALRVLCLCVISLRWVVVVYCGLGFWFVIYRFAVGVVGWAVRCVGGGFGVFERAVF